ncbi:MAG: M16 family metallopeptidase [Opitutales bacterium]
MQKIPERNERRGAEDLIERIFQAPVRRRVLSNGLTLLHRPDFSSPVISVQVWIKTGSIHEGPRLGCGLSHFLEHMLFKGTERRGGKAIGREVHGFGGVINAYTSFDRTVYHIDAPSDAFAASVDLLSDMAFHARLPEEEVRRERDVILREIDMGQDDPDRRIGQALFRTAFQRHPFREPVIGHRELFESVSAEELQEYYKARYVPNNMVVSVAGNIKMEDCEEVVSANFGAVPRGRLAPVPIEEEPVQLSARREDETGDFNLFRGSMGFKVPHLSHSDGPALDALAHALGGGESAVLWQELRNRLQLVHHIDCRNWNPGSSGLFWISYICDPENADEVEETIERTLLAAGEEGFSEPVVEKARRHALSSEVDGRRTMSGQAARQGMAEVVIGDLQYARDYLRSLQNLAGEDLRSAARKYLRPERRSTVTLGPAGKGGEKGGVIEAAASGLPPFETVRLENGVRILLQPDPRLPKVQYRCVMQAGPLFEDPAERGISALTGELLVKDTASRTGAEISTLIENLGGDFYAGAGNNTVYLGLDVFPHDNEVAIDLLKDALTCPVFDASTLQTERDSQIAEIDEENDDVQGYGFRRLRERFFGEHPFRHGPAGDRETVRKLDRDSVVRHFERIVKGSNVVLAVSGDFDRDALLEQLEPAMNRVAAGKVLSNTDKEVTFERPGGAEEAVEFMDREQAVVLLGFPDAGLRGQDYVAGEVLNELFSGMSSRLFERVREERGMAYFVGSTRVVGLNAGMFVLYAGTRPDLKDEVLREMDEEIARVAAGEVGEEELERCRTRLKAARSMGRQTSGARAMYAALQTSYGLPIEDEATYAKKVDAIDVAALAAFTRRFLNADHSVRLVVGPEEELSIAPGNKGPEHALNH